ncbi:hypothetical protein CMI37_11615 [Candidatus Pacearchaeota archaeon]|nr:hypothetical protein [Candidatus Pacearchaeota archaeon]|tara:strand:- start:2310 stop:3125 length:816 start_codon:yes stop_codon:yes gene_type:complete
MNKWAVIGLGFISPRHLKAIKWIGDEILIGFDKETEWEQMIEGNLWKKVTHVAICTPNFLHYRMCEAMKDKVVLCEKPLTLTSEEALKLPDNVFTVLQLRHNKEIVALKSKLDAEPEGTKHSGKMTVIVKRDKEYWKGWKGDESKSGGILFNLGIHYFDLLIHLFGDKYKIKKSDQLFSIKNCFLPDPPLTIASGTIDFDGNIFDYHLAIRDTDDQQDRRLEIDGKEISLSKKDNLSFEDLHKDVYMNLKHGVGVKPQEAAKSIRLIEKLR